MESPDLDHLMRHFKDKIDTIHNLIPFMFLCNGHLTNNGHRYPIGVGENSDFNCHYGQGSFEEDSLDDSDNNNTGQHSYPDLSMISSMVTEMKVMINEMKTAIVQQNSDLESQRERLKQRNAYIKEYLEHIKKNMPSFMQKGAAFNKEQAPTASTEPSTKSTAAPGDGLSQKPPVKSGPKPKVPPAKVAPTKKATMIKVKSDKNQSRAGGGGGETKVPRKPGQEEAYKNWPEIAFVTVDEFESIPQYMRGRVTYEMLNKAVSDFNQTMSEKYQLMSTPYNKYTEADIKKYQVFKGQENGDTLGEFFILFQDFKTVSEIKADNTVKIVFTCLRHCKRIKEIRGPAKLIRYAVIKGETF